MLVLYYLVIGHLQMLEYGSPFALDQVHICVCYRRCAGYGVV